MTKIIETSEDDFVYWVLDDVVYLGKDRPIVKEAPKMKKTS